jgi:hypothetical protein
MVGGNGPAQSWSWPPTLDALIAAPKHHTLLYENDRVRALDVYIAPGDTVPLHTHCWPSLLYQMSFAHFVRRDEHGKVLVDTRRTELPTVPVATWVEPYPPHTIENVDTVALHAIAVELKL